MADIKLKCDIYGLEVFIEDINMKKLFSKTFTIIVNKIINPDVDFKCQSGNLN